MTPALLLLLLSSAVDSIRNSHAQLVYCATASILLYNTHIHPHTAVVVVTTYVKYTGFYTVITVALIFVVAKLTLLCGVASHRVRFSPQHFYARVLRSMAPGGRAVWRIVLQLLGAGLLCFVLISVVAIYYCWGLCVPLQLFVWPRPIVMSFIVVKCVMSFVLFLISLA